MGDVARLGSGQRAEMKVKRVTKRVKKPAGCAGGGIVQTTPDVQVKVYANIGLIDALSEPAYQWLRINTHSENWQWAGRQLATDRRYTCTVVSAMRKAGFQVDEV